MKYLLDTNICIYIIKQNPASVVKKFATLTLGNIGISSITFAELMYGVEKSQHRNTNKLALEEFALPLEIIPFDENAAAQYGTIRSSLEKRGTPIGALDFLIAAHALSIKATLITNNKKEFERVPNLKAENWI